MALIKEITRFEVPAPVVIDAGGIKIAVKQFVSEAEKYALLKATVQSATEADGMISDFLLGVAFEINLLKLYTDIEFEDDDNSNIYDTYDILDKGGIISSVVDAMPHQDYKELFAQVQNEVALQREHNKTFAGSIGAVIQQLLDSEDLLEKFKETVNGFDKEKVAEIVSLAEHTGYQGQ